ncbi:ABC transporter substrate-binding protein [Bradyrhizobium diazoefficiens]|uniref:ABC transporter substrate-binding protein n=1 Tax=Bradyrhizobium sp. WYCCWR 12699 TaxID=3064203 RepID=UPI001BA5426F|nr:MULTISPECIES: ABC transporter substrate-binding protein [Bradyrhizobium]MBR0928110.1 ABC transporter substrate-binding protein [Bradyrhizobium diazoefficiens]MDT4742884.1 ABC transporter substrate-binding protein [Bradyrhizobium sp. WYCCWR 12699]
MSNVMHRTISRRVALIGCLGLVARNAVAQRSRTWRVAYLVSGRAAATTPVIKDTLRSLGYEEGKNLVFEVREANGHYSELPDLMQQLLQLKPDVVIAEATPAIAAAQKATSTIPIVMSPSTDPIGSGFVKSFARPGGNITGVANMFGDLTAKTLDIVQLVFPNVAKLGVLTSNNPTHPALYEVARDAAAKIGISAERYIAANPEDLKKAYQDMKAGGCDVVYVLADPIRPSLPPIALEHRLPSVFQVNSYTELGGLMSYGPDILPLFVKAAHYVDRILKGGNPAELPVEQPTQFVFAINLQTAKALGLSIPEKVLIMADKVIE